MIKKVLLAVFYPILTGLVTLPLEILGLFMVVIAYKYRGHDLEDLPRWIRPWANPEDWTGGWLGHEPEDNCIPRNLRNEFQGFWGFYRYHALRNRAHGLRAYDWHNRQLVEGEIEYETNERVRAYSDWWLWKHKNPQPGDTWWYVAWQGNLVGVKWIRYFKLFGKLRYVQQKFGWRVNPNDADGYNETSMRWRYGTTSTIQPPHFGVAGSDYE